MEAKKPIAVVTGANRGLGLETCRQLAKRNYKVILTSRDQQAGGVAADTLRTDGLDVEYHPLDVTDPTSVKQLAEHIEREIGHLDVLVNNAGVFVEKTDPVARTITSGLETDIDDVRDTFEINTLGPLMLAQALIPLMKGNGRIVNVSSGMGQLSEMGSGGLGYRLSKTALNAVTRTLANELGGTQIKMNSVCPGWVRTDMGGPSANRSIDEGVKGIVWAATLPDNGPTGGFFRDGRTIPW
ncbi:MAG: SDR family oxidoreductase [Acidiferrobacterales bacterium]